MHTSKFTTPATWQVDPKNVRALCNYAVLLRDGDKDIEAARTLLERARQAEPDNEWFQYIEQQPAWSKHVNVRPGRGGVGVRAGDASDGIRVGSAKQTDATADVGQRKKRDSRPSVRPIPRHSGITSYRGGVFKNGVRQEPQPQDEDDDITKPGVRLPRGMTADDVEKITADDIGVGSDEMAGESQNSDDDS
jgi:hypothetical protein